MGDLGLLVGTLRWLSAVLAFCGGISTLLWDPRKEDPVTQRRRLTTTGWIRILTVVVSLVVFVAADFEDRRLTAARAAKEQAALAADVTFKEQEIAALRQIIESQERGLSYFRHLVLVQESLDGLTVSWGLPPAVIDGVRRDSEITKLLADPADAYFRTCLQTLGMQASQTPRGRWAFRCVLSRPHGVREVTFDYGPDQPQGRAFERALDRLLSRHFSLRQVDGEFLVLLTPDHRPSSVRFSPAEITVSLRRPSIKLNRLELARVEVRMDVERPELAPASITIRSLDPNVRLDRTLSMRWAMRRSGSAWRFPGPGEEPEEIPLRSAFSGPHALAADFSALLFPRPRP